MRILELRFENLNSLYGQWSIDFTLPEYVQEGIFVISGATGAGKSTLLDAICLALYGRTPRLKSISKTTNEIMSRQTGECFAEVLFETSSGQFRAHWSQHRARKKPDGKLAESKHEISDTATGKILTSKKRDTATRIVKETGMDFDRFTRSMMLAQGGFAAFLQAAPDERAPILEQITGTNIYSDISKKVHERRTKEGDELKLLEAQMGGIQVLNDEAEKRVAQDLAESQKKEKSYYKQNDALRASLAWLSKIKALETQIASLNKALEVVFKKQADFEADRERLKNAIKVLEFDNEYATLSAKRQQQKIELSSREDIQSKIPEIEKTQGIKEADFKTAQEAFEKIQACHKKEMDLIKQARVLDQEIRLKNGAFKELQSECAAIEAQISSQNKTQKKLKSDQAQKTELFEATDKFLSEHQRDANLDVALAGIREKIRHLGEASILIEKISKQITDFKKQWEKETKIHKKQEEIWQKFKKDHDAATQEIFRIEKEMATVLDGRSLQGYRREYEGLLREMAYKKTIADLETERKKLKAGKACPLCGSIEHPFARGQVPETGDIQKKIDALALLTQKLESMENNFKSAREKEKQAGNASIDAEKQQTRNQYREKRLAEEIERCKTELKTALENKEKLIRTLLSSLKPFGVQPGPDEDIEIVFQSLEERAKAFKAHTDEQSRIEKDLSRLMAQTKEGEGILTTLNAALVQKQSDLKTHQTVFEKLKYDRGQLYGKKDPDTEEFRMEKEVDTARQSEAQVRKIKDDIARLLVSQKARLSDLNKSVTVRQPELDSLEKLFFKNINGAGFKNEDDFISCRLPVEEKNKLLSAAQSLDEKQRDITSRKKDRTSQLAVEREKKLTDASEDHLEKEQAKYLGALKEQGEKIGALKQRLTDNSDAKARLEKQVMQIKARKKEYLRWDVLHSLIGSADGKKYRNFAQGITFELMVSHANQQLGKMSDRYLLVRDEKQPLELNIMDDYQAGEIRSTKNLSGGESFIVSLALALGLSGMASRNVRVDCLFLDEGFGTLDEEALETALQSLSSLQQTGKLIGVISHVHALKENISTQIQITPVSGGKSRIQGPGCERL